MKPLTRGGAQKIGASLQTMRRCVRGREESDKTRSPVLSGSQHLGKTIRSPAISAAEGSSRQALAAARPARRDDPPSADGRHPGPKPVPSLAHELARLICPLHRSIPSKIAPARRQKCRSQMRGVKR